MALCVALSWPFLCQSGWFSVFLGSEEPFVCSLFGMRDVRLNPLLIRRFRVRAPGDPLENRCAATGVGLQSDNGDGRFAGLDLSLALSLAISSSTYG